MRKCVNPAPGLECSHIAGNGGLLVTGEGRSSYASPLSFRAKHGYIAHSLKRGNMCDMSVLTEKQSKKKVMPVSPGRPKGVPNRTTTLLKDAILKAAENAGNDLSGDDADGDGLVTYLVAQAKINPGPFMALLGKVLPMQVVGDSGNPIVHKIIQRIVDPQK